MTEQKLGQCQPLAEKTLIRHLKPSLWVVLLTFSGPLSLNSV
ncbi:hypothetical protein EC40967_A0006 [Escherichia coli 4.0967]|uniref:Uncharacterized protein n=9 Tax=Enterobacteriaceae TaxID=543 RepID=A0A7M1HXX0_ECOLX|nr:hypothetical protein [Leclercia sp.]ABQ02739.1 hypothetical protein [Klebsiella pneumoniae]AKJ19380.1 hypothetical protein [Enterobacter cloacae]ALP55097.1 hypothetical protein KPH11_72 [Klebsiella pneumoniae subsp. pneumoniae]APA22995.1 hypothetical protein [Salmonella enterica subsp. enterica serovar Typhimurium]ASO63745.1 hypothetical protein [Citrobacter freundii]AUF80466.1 Hypothetical protein [Raoultella ornithinolytica]AVJ83514.1 hypothetical protein CSC02_5110 [Enterobacter hormae